MTIYLCRRKKNAFIFRQLSRIQPTFHCDSLKHIHITVPFSMQGLACFLHLVPYNKNSITLHFKRTVWDVAAGVVLTVTLTHSATEIIPASKSLHSNWKLEKLLDRYTSQARNKKGSATGRWHTVCTPSTLWVMPPPWSRDTPHLLISYQRDINYQWRPLKVLVKKKRSWCMIF